MTRLFALLFLLGAGCLAGRAAARTLPPAPPPTSAYLFAYFTGNDKAEEAIHFALSPDGYHYVALNGNQPVLSSAAISATGGVRDPHLLRGADGTTFYMAATDMVSAKGWDSNRGLVLLRSTDLLTWQSSAINFQQRYPGQASLKRVWAPQTIYDAQAGKYLVYFLLQYGSEPDKIYYAYANKDFTDLEGEPKQLFYSPTNGSCIDGDIVAKDGKFYLKAFSSPDLVHWRDEGVILDLPKQVSWAKTRAWAPCIIEQKTAAGYRYAYYFCADAKIGVATSTSPTGPFVDSGQPLLDHLPAGMPGGQQIDPAVFHDPQSGRNYLYWGNGYLAGAELSADLVSLKPGTTRVLTPNATYREGSHVFYRAGTYYFMWSENDTRDPDYRVRYGTAASPLGPLRVPSNNLVLSKNPAAGRYGTGHNSTIQVPGRDEWYLVYHRFTYPRGIELGGDAGFHREVCLDKLEFNPDGSIRPVLPTHAGIAPVGSK